MEIFDNWERVSAEERQAVLKLLDNGVLNLKGTTLTSQFEAEFANAVGANHCIASSSGTAALVCALAALGTEFGKRVLLPTYAYHALLSATVTLGARPIFIDSSNNSLQVDINAFASACEEHKPHVTIIQHYWGNPAPMTAIKAICQKYNVLLITDCSQSFGASWDGSQASLHGDIAIYSLGLGKWVTGGELGVAVTDSSVLADKCLMFSGTNQAKASLRNPELWAGAENAWGIKTRPHVFAVALARESLKRVREKIKRTSSLGSMVCEILFHCPWVHLDPILPLAKRVYWRLVFEHIESESTITTGQLIRILKAHGLPVTGDEYHPLLHQYLTARTNGFSDFCERAAHSHLGTKEPSLDEPYLNAACRSTRLVTLNIPAIPSGDYLLALSNAIRSLTFADRANLAD